MVGYVYRWSPRADDCIVVVGRAVEDCVGVIPVLDTKKIVRCFIDWRDALAWARALPLLVDDDDS